MNMTNENAIREYFTFGALAVLVGIIIVVVELFVWSSNNPLIIDLPAIFFAFGTMSFLISVTKWLSSVTSSV